MIHRRNAFGRREKYTVLGLPAFAIQTGGLFTVPPGQVHSEDRRSPHQPRSSILDPQSSWQAENSEVAFGPDALNRVDVAVTDLNAVGII